MSANVVAGPAKGQMDIQPISRCTDLGQSIRAARLDAVLAQHELAAKADVSRAWLARVEAGHRKAEIGLLMSTADALGLAFSLGPIPPDDTDPELDEALRIAGLT